MTPDDDLSSLGRDNEDIVSATEGLFLEIASNADARLKEAVTVMNGRRRLVRLYEAALIPDREEELAALKACWNARDIPRLRDLIFAYYKRRHDLAPQIVALMNAPQSPQ